MRRERRHTIERLVALGLLLLAPLPGAAATYTVYTNGDSWLKEPNPSENHGTDVENSSKAGTNDRNRPVWKFDLSSIPADSLVSSALASFYVTDSSSGSRSVHRITDSWSEGTVNWTNTAADYDATAIDTFTPSSSSAFVDVDLTQLVQDWICGTYSNHGILFATSSTNEAKFASEEWSTSGQRPYLTIVTGGGDTVLDQFSSISYSGNNGTANWTTSWVEVGESDGTGSGNVRVTSSSDCASGNCLRIGGDSVDIDNRGVYREADLSGASSATLTFSYRRDEIQWWSDGSVSIQVSGDGGSNWTTLATYNLTSDDSGQVSQSFDISSYIASNTRVRFYGSGTDTESYFRADNVQIEYTSGGGGCSTTLDHFSISHDGSGTTCQAENVTIAAHTGSHSAHTSYTGTISLSTSTSRGNWSLVTGSGTLTNSGSGAATYTFDSADAGEVVLGLTDTVAETVNIDVSGDSAAESAGEDADLTFSAASSSSTVRDEFTAISYSGNDGTANWSGSWTEVGESDGTGSGSLRVASSSVCASGNCIRIGGDVDLDGRALYREADLSGAIAATLTFSYRREDLSGWPDGDVTIQVSGNGGSSWTSLATYDLDTYDSSQQSASFDISAYIASNTRIRFQGSGSDVDTYFRADNVQIEYEMPDPGCGVDHFSISHDGSGVNCQAEYVTIAAHDGAHDPITDYSGTIALSTSTGHGDWSLVSGSGSLTNNGSGSATYVFAAADSGDVVLALADSFAETVDIGVSGDGTAESSGHDPALTFAATGFIFTADGTRNALGTQIGGKASNVAPGAQTLELRAVRTSDDTGACEDALDGANTIELAFECENPGTCGSAQLAVNGTPLAANPNGSVSSYTGVSLDFGDATDDSATIALTYPEVGQVQLHARYTLSPSGELMTGASNSFVWRPFAFDVSATGNPGATDASGSVFTSAGTDFTATARAVLWSAADDADNDGQADGHGDSNPANNANLANNTAASSYGRESSVEAVALSAELVSPAGGNDPGLTNGTTISSFTSGSGSTTTARYGEVGVIEISSAVSDANYLGIGATETAKILGRSGYVGRFRPYDFAIATNTPSFTPGCAAGAFTYVGSAFGFGTASVLTVTARNAQGTTTQNYTGSYWKLTNSSLTGRSYTAASGTLDTSGLPDTSADPAIADSGSGSGTLTFSSGSGLVFQRGAPTAPFDAEIRLEQNVLDADAVAYASNPAAFGQASAGNGIAFAGSKTQRWGRVALANAHGAEVSALPVPLVAEYWNGSAFAANAADACTSAPVAELAMTPSPGSLSSTPSIANSPFVAGDAGLALSAPGAGNTGYVDLVYDLSSGSGAGLGWLQYDWDDDGGHDDNPSSRATFGIYAGDEPIIYQRELY
jgi:hypothetical protein